MKNGASQRFLTTAIPGKDIPTKAFMSDDFNSRLVSVSTYFGDSVRVEPVYYNMGLSPVSECYLRGRVLKKLELAYNLLPEGITFLIYDGWRSNETQMKLYKKFYDNIKTENPDLEEEELEAMARKFVSKPSDDVINAPVHNTGGAVDLTLYDTNQGMVLRMGTQFDDFSDKAHTNYYETVGDNEEAKTNRRMLYNVMCMAGFTNYPAEWWHYDYGDRFWSYYTGTEELFTGIELK